MVYFEAAHKLIRKDDAVVNADAGYVGIENRKEIREDEHLSKVEYRVNSKKGEARKWEAAVYRGLAKNTARLYMLFASANLLKRAWSERPYMRPAAV